MNGPLAVLTIESYLTGLVARFFEVARDSQTVALVAFLLTALIHAALLLQLFGGLPVVYIWLERKVAGRIQDRLGPTRVGGKFGWLQTIADGIKLLQKEDLIPAAADSVVFRMAPYLAGIASFAAFMVLPVANGWVGVAAECGAFLILALMSLEVLGIILGGYSSGSKWALFGAMREAAQMVSYEIPMAICALIPLMIAGSLNLQVVARMQTGSVLNWFLFHDPFAFFAFFCYFTVATASVKRAPFDLAEAESELVAGFHTEYSGFRWSIFFLAEYASMFAVSGIAALLFLGGWETGLVFPEAILGSLKGWMPDFPVPGFDLGGYIGNVFAAHVFVLKASVLVTLQIWVRWTLPRLRIDQVMTTCLKYLVPISCVLFAGAAIWPLILASTSKSARPVIYGAPLNSASVEPVKVVPSADPSAIARTRVEVVR